MWKYPALHGVRAWSSTSVVWCGVVWNSADGVGINGGFDWGVGTVSVLLCHRAGDNLILNEPVGQSCRRSMWTFSVMPVITVPV